MFRVFWGLGFRVNQLAFLIPWRSAKINVSMHAEKPGGP